MKISTILDHIDSGHMALPEFQRGYVWGKEQVRGLFSSLYRRHPVGGLLVWATESVEAEYRGNQKLAAGIVKLLLDGQQRMTSLYGVVRGQPPKFFDGNRTAFTSLRFNLETEVFEFWQPIKMQDDPLWVDVTAVMQKGNAGMGEFITAITAQPELAPKVGDYVARLGTLLAILDIDLHIEEVSGKDKTLDVVVDIFNRVNSGGTKLSKGDLALAKICAEWPEARNQMKAALQEWHSAGYDFNLDWLLRSVNTVLTGKAKFQYLHDKEAPDIQDGLKRAAQYIDVSLNMIAGRLGLDHDRVLFGRFAIPVMVRYLDQHGGTLDEIERDKLLFWFAQAGMWGRFSGSTESYIDKDLSVLENGEGVNGLLEALRLWHGGLAIESGHFDGWSLGARFYPVLYMLTRMGEARDWGTGLPLKANLLGKMSSLEVHHIFPKARLYKTNYRKNEVNALANFCFLTKDTNLNIRDKYPSDYFVEVESRHTGALASQWIPMDENLWKLENYLDFLEARKALLAEEANKRMLSLLHGDTQWMEGRHVEPPATITVKGGISDEVEEQALLMLNQWVQEQGLPAGILSYDYSDSQSGQQLAVFDLVWSSGLQEELSQPVAVLLNEDNDTIALANQAGFRCFTSVNTFKQYVKSEILAEVAN
ncbi:MAG: hypothetical protein CR991_08455 [Proteobacteria bacterium]|nr:MAG: hypothetical protein CR991_08455 [Pseudomonadota bacterium]